MMTPLKNCNRVVKPGEVGEHHQRIVERVALRVRTEQWRLPVFVHGAEHVVVGDEVVEAELFDAEGDRAHGVGATAEFDLWVYNSELHTSTISHEKKRVCARQLTDGATSGHGRSRSTASATSNSAAS